MTVPTIKEAILQYLEGKDFVWGGLIDRAITVVTGAKESNVSRRCRELKDEDKLEAIYRQVEGKGPHVVMYRKKIQSPVFTAPRTLAMFSTKTINN